MERVQEALDNNDFLWFLNDKRHYTNGPTYFEQLKYWLELEFCMGKGQFR
jgi:hypothetical protein